MLVSGSDCLDLLDQVQDEIATTRAEVVAQATAGLVAMPWSPARVVSTGDRRERMAPNRSDHQLDMHPYRWQALSGNVSYFSRTLLDPQSELAQMCCRVISPSTMVLREGLI